MSSSAKRITVTASQMPKFASKYTTTIRL